MSGTATPTAHSMFERRLHALVAGLALLGVALVLSMGGLAHAMRELPIGTAYAVWVGIGAVGTVGWAMATGQEPASVVRLLLVGLIVAAVVGLKLTH